MVTALLSGTLQTFQRYAYDDTTLNISCPENTTLDILLARYGWVSTVMLTALWSGTL